MTSLSLQALPATFAALAIVLAGCNKPAAPPPAVPAQTQAESVSAADAGGPVASEPTPAWEETSLRSTYLLRQFRTGPGSCRLESVRAADQQVRWASDTCLPATNRLVFLSDDGDRFLVLETLPALSEGSMLAAELGRAYLMGTPARTIKATRLLERATGLRQIGERFHWLSGVRDEPGPAPALVPEGVRVSILGGGTWTLGFDGAESASADAGMALDASTSLPLPDAGGELAAPSSAGDRAAREAEKAEATWRASFKEVRAKVAAAEQALEVAKARVESIEKDGLPDHAPKPRFYDPSMTAEQRNQAQAIEWLDYKRQIAEHLHEARRQVEEAESQLKFARQELEDLERKARFEAVPLEWRK